MLKNIFLNLCVCVYILLSIDHYLVQSRFMYSLIAMYYVLCVLFIFFIYYTLHRLLLFYM